MTDFLLLAFIFLIAGVFAVPIASRLKLGSVLGYLLAGIAISPILSALHVDVISIQHFAEFGVVMMLFLVGLELEPRMLFDEAAEFIEEYRATDARDMREIADVYVPNVPIHTVPEYVSKARELNAVIEAQLRAGRKPNLTGEEE